MEVKEQKIISLISKDLQDKMMLFKLKLGALKAGYPDLSTYHPGDPRDPGYWDIFPKVPVMKSRIYAGDSDFSYSHHHIICKFKDTYVVSWSNGLKHEDHPGQEVHYSWSKDIDNWQPYRVLAHTDPKSNIVRSNAGMYATADKLYAYIGVCESLGNTNISTGTMVTKRMRLDTYETDDLVRWKKSESIMEEIYLFEGPRQIRSGDFLCCGINNRDWSENIVLRWDKGSDPASQPEQCAIPRSIDGVMPEQGTWYQTDDGDIWLYLRDGSYSARLALTWSRDGGRTWSELHRTDFPNSYSRAHAGRLGNGKFYIAGNNYDHFLDRSHMMMAISDDGKVFDRMYILLNDPTTRRFEGYHKENGYHYPNCIADRNRFLMVYSVNKEDIEIISVDIRELE